MAIPSYEEVYRALEERHGKELQKKLSQTSAAVCGLGGLGSNAAICLARAGIGKLHLIDFDRVDISNINRQQYFLNQIGMFKTDAMRENLKMIAPYTEVVTDCVKLDRNNITEIIGSESIIIEAFDKAEAKAELVNTVLEKMPEKYLVSGSGMAGLDSADLIKTRRITKRFYICGDEKSDIADGKGLISSRVMACAAQQAHIAIKIINGDV